MVLLLAAEAISQIVPPTEQNLLQATLSRLALALQRQAIGQASQLCPDKVHPKCHLVPKAIPACSVIIVLPSSESLRHFLHSSHSAFQFTQQMFTKALCLSGDVLGASIVQVTMPLTCLQSCKVCLVFLWPLFIPSSLPTVLYCGTSLGQALC